MRALRTIEEVFGFVVFGFGGAGVGVGVGDLGGSTVPAYVDAMPVGDEGGDCGRKENVAREERGLEGQDRMVREGVIPIFGWDCEVDGGGHDELDWTT